LPEPGGPFMTKCVRNATHARLSLTASGRGEPEVELKLVYLK
jgi:hypothetical protein